MKELLVDLLGKPDGIVLFQLIMAARFTVLLSAMAFIGGGIVGAIVCTARVSPVGWLSRVGSAYVWLFQSTPLLMLLFLIGLGLPKFTGWNVDPWTAAGLSLTLYASAYLAEVWRGAIATIGRGQWEAGRALGLTFSAHAETDHIPPSPARRTRAHRRLSGANHQRHIAGLHHRFPRPDERGQAVGERGGAGH